MLGILAKPKKARGLVSRFMNSCTICGEKFIDDIRFLNHMMEKHGFRNSNNLAQDRNSRGY